MFLDEFHSVGPDGGVRIGTKQASRFAKEIAGDYNPIHDTDSSRFCVPGDLLASLVLGHYGLSESMQFGFRGMVGANDTLYFPEAPGDVFEIRDADDKVCLFVERAGERLTDRDVVEGFIRSYVAFSGQTFPHYLKPLMADEGVMFNPDRPLVIYDQMGFALHALDFADPELHFAGGTLDARGKRGDVVFEFEIEAEGRTVGTGSKHIVMSGLRPYDEARMEAFCEAFDARKHAHTAARASG